MSYWFAFVLTLLAGLSTGIGSILVFFTKKDNSKFLSISLGFSAGVMIYVSMVEILQEAKITLIQALGDVNGSWLAVSAFFAGVIFIAVIDRLVPSEDNPHEVCSTTELRGIHSCPAEPTKLMRMGVFTAFAVAIHNFPEGLATFTAALQDFKLGAVIAVAVAIHNIPEGIAVGVPIYYATGNKKKAFRLSFLSGLSEPIGALIGMLILYRFLNDVVFGVLFASVAGIMVFISLDELLPMAREYGKAHLAIYGLISGMMVMALSLLLFI